MPLNNIVDVQIDRQTASITRVGFGTLLIVLEFSTGSEPTDRVKEFASAQAVADDTEWSSASAIATAAFSGEFKPQSIKLAYKLDTEDYDAALLGNIRDADDDWYAIAIDSATQADIEAIAAEIEATYKLFLARTADAAVLDPGDDTDVGSVLLSNRYSRTALIYHSDAATEYPEVTWGGSILPFNPGSVTWAFKALPGIPGETFTAGAISALEAKRVTRYEAVGGLPVTVGGYTSDSGAFVDVIRGLDWLRQRMAEDLFNRLANVPKVPYTNAGIASIEEIVRNRLQIAVANDVIADDENLSVTVPLVSQVQASDRSERLLPGVEFTARLAGAIHEIVVRGTATA